MIEAHKELKRPPCCADKKAMAPITSVSNTSIFSWPALLSFALSFDDFIITNFNAGAAVTFPRYVYTAAARGIPAEANVIASAVFFLAIAAVLISQIGGALKRGKLARA